MTEAPCPESLGLIGLDHSRVQDCVVLSAEANWNQTAADWRMMLTQGRGFGYEDRQGALVASSLILPFGSRFGWISMILVTGSWQRHGLATRLLEICIEALERDGLLPILDATPAGAMVYTPLSFERLFDITRWQGDAGPLRAPSTATRPLERDSLGRVLDDDRRVFGGERRTILASLLERGGPAARAPVDKGGFVLARDGRTAWQIGPLVAADEATACLLLEDTLAVLQGPVFIDVPDHQTAVSALLKRRGFTVQRPFTRMARGGGADIGDPSRLFALAGPELG